MFERSEEKLRETKISFFNKCGIPGVIGAVDGTHIQIIRPKHNEHLYFNRKLKHSINAMAVSKTFCIHIFSYINQLYFTIQICDHKMIIRAIDGRFGGACHDSHVWNLSDEKQYLKNKYQEGDNSRILGLTLIL